MEVNLSRQEWKGEWLKASNVSKTDDIIHIGQHRRKVRVKLNRNSLTASALFILLAASPSLAQPGAGAPGKSGYAPVNGLKLYYEVQGSGEPLILIHGGLGAGEMFAPIMPALSQRRQVITVDLQAHGHTADIDRPITFEAMADDIAGLAKYLGIAKADVMGYSLGGGVALRTAAQHPDLVKRLVLVSVAFRRDGWYPEIIAGMSQVGAAAAEPMKQTPMYQMYSHVAPRPADWPALLTKVGDLLRKDYDWSSDVAGLKMPTLLVFGDADAVRTAHAVQFFELLGGGKKDGGWDGSGISNARLAILPGLTHYTVFSSPLLATTVAPFLDALMPVAK
jgi:pimeloyl-ACP methyl ester carboxylesterase